MTKTIFTVLFAAAMLSSGAQAADKDYAKCAITPASQLAFIDTFKTPAECEAACSERDGCMVWTFLPHSFDKDMPGQCKLIDKVFKEEESTKMFCGKM